MAASASFRRENAPAEGAEAPFAWAPAPPPTPLPSSAAPFFPTPTPPPAPAPAPAAGAPSPWDALADARAALDGAADRFLECVAYEQGRGCRNERGVTGTFADYLGAALPRLRAAMAGAVDAGAPASAIAALTGSKLEAMAATYGRSDPARRAHLLSVAAQGVDAARAAAGDAAAARWVAIAYDLETTGMRPGVDAVTELAAAAVGSGSTFSSLVSLAGTGVRAVPAAVQALTGISTAMLADAPPFSEVAPRFEAWVDAQVGGPASGRVPLLVAHNGKRFDAKALAAAYGRAGRAPPAGWAALDTLDLAKKAFDGRPVSEGVVVAGGGGRPGGSAAATAAAHPPGGLSPPTPTRPASLAQPALRHWFGLPPPTATHRAGPDVGVLVDLLPCLLAEAGLRSAGHAVLVGEGAVHDLFPAGAAAAAAVGGGGGGGTAAGARTGGGRPAASTARAATLAPRPPASTSSPSPPPPPPPTNTNDTALAPALAGLLDQLAASGAALDASFALVGPEPHPDRLAGLVAAGLAADAAAAAAGRAPPATAAALPLAASPDLRPAAIDKLARAGFVSVADLLGAPPRAYETVGAALAPGAVRVRLPGSVTDAAFYPARTASAAGRAVFTVLLDNDGSPPHDPPAPPPRAVVTLFFRGRGQFAGRRLVAEAGRGARVLLLGDVASPAPPPPGGAWEMAPGCEVLPAASPRAVRAAGAAVLAKYSARAPLKADAFPDLVGAALRALPPDAPAALPPAVAASLGLAPWLRGAVAVHEPASEPQAEAGRRRLAVEELVVMYTAVELARARAGSRGQAAAAAPVPGDALPAPAPRPPVVPSLEAVDRALASLPFTLTAGQAAALGEVLDDIGAARSGAPPPPVPPAPMARLLQGDVGSGKTVVALLALLAVAGGGGQGAMMAPTEVLAAQLHANLDRLVGGLLMPGVVEAGAGGPAAAAAAAAAAASSPPPLHTRRPTIALLTGSTRAAERRRILGALAAGDVDIVVGTHALVSAGVSFANLALAVVDEQHRFGVSQRARLATKAPTMPHVLAMTATPIPRTLALALSNETDCSTIRERPPGRQPVVTHVVPDDGDAGPHRARVAAALRAEIAGGGRVFVVCPRIEADGDGSGGDEDGGGGGDARAPSPASSLRAAEDEHRRLVGSGALGPGVTAGLLHGRMKPADKASALDAFRAGDTAVLIATSVIEVGVDVPEATAIVVEGADRFGLAQLHQLRGRVGRGDKPATCWLFAMSEAGAARLQPLADSDDGFVIAQADLAARGAGDMVGRRQSGLEAFGGLRAARIERDLNLVERARRAGGALAAALGGTERAAWPPGLAAAIGAFEADDAAAAGALELGAGSAAGAGPAAAASAEGEEEGSAAKPRRGRPPTSPQAVAAAAA